MRDELVRFGVTRRWSDAVVACGIAYFVEVPEDSSLGPREQFDQVLNQADARLKQVGSDRTRLVQVLVYLPYAEDLPIFNEAWDAWIPMGHAPVRACTHPKLAAEEYRVELVITAAIATKALSEMT